MKSQANETSLRTLAFSIGDFIRYWGFRRIHGAIWTLAYLSSEPVSCSELARRLKVSKALVSPALAELEGWGLLEKQPSPNEKVVLYSACSDVDGVIRRVLREREIPLLHRIQVQFNKLNIESPVKSAGVDGDRLQEVGAMIQAGQSLLGLLLASGDINCLPKKLPRSPNFA